MSNHSLQESTSENISQRNANIQPRNSNLDNEELKNEYFKALSYIETLKKEKNALKAALESYIKGINSSEDNNLEQPIIESENNSITGPKSQEKRLSELEKENEELKRLLKENNERPDPIQQVNPTESDQGQEIEALRFENKQLKVDLNRQHEELCLMTAKLAEIQAKNTSFSIAEQEQNKEIPEVDRNSILKYTNYVYGLINALDKNHFAYCCFEERFSKDCNLFHLAYSNDQTSLLLKALKYITDLLMNISTNYHIGTPAISMANNNNDNIQVESSSTSEEKPNINVVQRVESPRVKKLLSSGDSVHGNMASSQDKEKPRMHEYIKTDEDVNLSEDLSENDENVESLEEKEEEIQPKPTLREEKDKEVNNYISVSELDAISKSQIRKESKELWKGFDSPKFNNEVDVLQAKSNRKQEIIDKSDKIEENDSKNPTKKEILTKKDVLSKFRELKKRCQEIKEQGIEFESRLQDSKRKYNTYTNLNLKQSEDMFVQKSHLEGPKSSSVNSLRNILWKDKDTSIVKHTNIGASQSTSAIRRDSDISLSVTNQHLNSWKDLATEEDYPKSQISRKSDYNSPLVSKLHNTEESNEKKRNISFISYVSPTRKSPQKLMTYQQINQAKKQFREEDEPYRAETFKRYHSEYSAKAFQPKGVEYSSFTVAFGKTETKKRQNESPSSGLKSIEDIPRRKKIGAYPSQTYDVIKGEELVRKRYLDQVGIMESTILFRNKIV